MGRFDTPVSCQRGWLAVRWPRGTMAQTAPDDAIARLEEAFECGDVPAVQRELRALEADHGKDVRVQVAQARWVLLTGDRYLGLRMMSAAMRNNPHSGLARAHFAAALLAEGAAQAAKPLLARALQCVGGRTALTHYAMGVVLATEGQYHEAMQHLQTAVELKPLHPGMRYQQGLVLSQLQQWDAAADALAICVEQAPDHLDAVELLAHALVERGDVPAAMAQLTQAVERHPDAADLVRMCSQLCMGQEDVAGALRMLKRLPAEECQVDDLCNMATLEGMQDLWADALAHAQEAVKRDATYWRAFLLLARALEATAHPRAEAMDAYRKAVELGDPQGEAGTRLGWLMLVEGMSTEAHQAVEVLEQARTRSADAPATLICLATAHAKCRNLEMAVPLCQALVDSDASQAIRDQALRLLKRLKAA